MNVPEQSRAAVMGFIKLISDADQRLSFVSNPEEVLRDQGLLDEFPDEVLEVVRNMSFGELSTLAYLNQRLVAAGMESPGEPRGVADIL
jgi:hypothetical protein